METENLHKTYIEVLRPIVKEPLPDFDSIGNYKDLTKTTDGESHSYLIATDYTDTNSDTYIKNHDKCLHLKLTNGAFTDILYYSTMGSIEATPKPITVTKKIINQDTGRPEIIEITVDWVDIEQNNNKGILAEVLIFTKEEFSEFLVKYIRADETNDIEEQLFEIYETGDIFRIVGMVI